MVSQSEFQTNKFGRLVRCSWSSHSRPAWWITAKRWICLAMCGACLASNPGERSENCLIVKISESFALPVESTRRYLPEFCRRSKAPPHWSALDCAFSRPPTEIELASALVAIHLNQTFWFSKWDCKIKKIKKWRWIRQRFEAWSSNTSDEFIKKRARPHCQKADITYKSPIASWRFVVVCI